MAFQAKDKTGTKYVLQSLRNSDGRFLKGDEKRQLEAFNDGMLNASNQGVMAIGEYFNVLFALPKLEKEKLAEFEKEYYELLVKYNLNKEVIK